MSSRRSSPIVICGRLLARAQQRSTPDGRYLLSIDIEAPMAPGAKPIVVRAVQDYGTGGSAGVACQSRARSLREGTYVEVAARSMRKRGDRLELHPIDELLSPELVTVDPRVPD